MCHTAQLRTAGTQQGHGSGHSTALSLHLTCQSALLSETSALALSLSRKQARTAKAKFTAQINLHFGC